jgi:hypothetical protein
MSLMVSPRGRKVAPSSCSALAELSLFSQRANSGWGMGFCYGQRGQQRSNLILDTAADLLVVGGD